MDSLAVSGRAGGSGTISMTVSQKTGASELGTVPVNITRPVMAIVTATREHGELEIQSASVAETRAWAWDTGDPNGLLGQDAEDQRTGNQDGHVSHQGIFFKWKLQVCVQSKHT